MKETITTLLACFLAVFVLAEEKPCRHGMTSHIGGAGTLVELEYQYRFVVRDKHAFSACIAINTVGINIGFPFGFNYTYGHKNQLLLAARFVPNIILFSMDEEIEVPFWSYLANFRIGYGRELVLFKENFTLYVYASPFMNLGSGRVLPWAGIGLTHYF
ncbi:MAG: hypothetical protein JXR21_00015 [Candidatus Marinimicrobia bacterium]|nr:hypothetical protein [Candidatus Neomarinimicrobiota bacterium]